MIRLVAIVTATAAGVTWSQAATDAIAGQFWRAGCGAVLGAACLAAAQWSDRRCNRRADARAAAPASRRAA